MTRLAAAWQPLAPICATSRRIKQSGGIILKEVIYFKNIYNGILFIIRLFKI